jgi:hypothetical protein
MWDKVKWMESKYKKSGSNIQRYTYRNSNTAKERTAYLTIYNNDLWYFTFQTDNYTDTTETSPSDVGDDTVRGFPLLTHRCTPLQALLF